MSENRSLKAVQLPRDILQIVGHYLNAHHLGKLWFSGDKHFQAVLTRHGIVEHFHLTFSSDRKLIWPNFISNFSSMRSLTVKASPDHSDVCMSNFDVHSIPKSVEWIDFNFLIQESFFAELYAHISASGASIPVIDVASHLPKLKHIILDSDYDQTVEISLPPLSVNFPSNLLTLYLPWQVRFHVSFMQFIPNSLTHLDIALKNDDAGDKFDFIENLPPNLTKLVLRASPTTALLKALPSSVTALTIRPHIVPFEPTPEDADWTLLPPKLTSLDCPVVLTESFVTSLPSTLTDLRHDDLKILDLEVVRLLPRELQNWQTPQIPLIREQAALARFLELLPPSLTLIPTLFHFRVDLSICRVLPEQLRSIAILAPAIRGPTNYLECLPESLLKLDGRELRISDLERLPRNITSLMTTISFFQEDGDPLLTLARYACLTSLTLLLGESKNVLCSNFNSLPEGMKNLSIQLFSDLNAIDWSLPWSKGLVSLILSSKLPLRDDLAKQWFMGLPRTLKILKLEFATSKPLDPSICFKNLPEGLTRLILSGLGPITDEHLDTLPRRIISLALYSLHAATFTVEAMQRLPPTITQLNLPSTSSVTISDDLPPVGALKSYQLGLRVFPSSKP